MLRMDFAQHWFYLDEEPCSIAGRCGALWASTSGRELVPNVTTLLKFRHLLDTRQLGEALLGLR